MYDHLIFFFKQGEQVKLLVSGLSFLHGLSSVGMREKLLRCVIKKQLCLLCELVWFPKLPKGFPKDASTEGKFLELMSILPYFFSKHVLFTLVGRWKLKLSPGKRENCEQWRTGRGVLWISHILLDCTFSCQFGTGSILITTSEFWAVPWHVGHRSHCEIGGLCSFFVFLGPIIYLGSKVTPLLQSVHSVKKSKTKAENFPLFDWLE